MSELRHWLEGDEEWYHDGTGKVAICVNPYYCPVAPSELEQGEVCTAATSFRTGVSKNSSVASLAVYK